MRHAPCAASPGPLRPPGDRILEPVNGKLGDKLAAISAPALVFWLGGLVAWSLGHGGVRALARAAGWLGQQSSFGAAAALVIVLAGVSASGLIVSRATLPALRLLEGYWPARPAWVAAYGRHRAAKVADQVDAELAAWQDLRLKRAPEAGDLAEIYRLEVALHRYPDPPGPFQPTRTGNLLRSAEGRPGAKYGLDAVTVWPQLWLVLPASTKDEITSARTALDNSVAATLWGILFCAFTPWTILALPAGLLVAVVAAVAWVRPGPRSSAACSRPPSTCTGPRSTSSFAGRCRPTRTTSTRKA